MAGDLVTAHTYFEQAPIAERGLGADHPETHSVRKSDVVSIRDGLPHIRIQVKCQE